MYRMGLSSRLTIRSTLRIALTLFCVTGILIITYISYTETDASIRSSFDREIQTSEILFTKSSIYIHRGLQLWDSSFNRNLARDLSLLLRAYDERQGDISHLNLSLVKKQIDPLYQNQSDFYLINASGVIESTTNMQDYLLDFSRWPDFHDKLEKIRQGDGFVYDEIVNGFQPGAPLRKFVYHPTSDHQYIAQVSLAVENESVHERSLLSYQDLVTYVLSQNPDLIDLHVINSLHRLVIGKSAYPSGKLDPESKAVVSRVFATEEREFITNPQSGTVTSYVFVPNAINDTPSAGYTNVVAKCIFSTSEITHQQWNNLIIHLFLALSATFIAILGVGMLSDRLSSPITTLVREIDQIADGEYDLEISRTGHPDLERIADAVRSMAQKIGGVVHELIKSEAKYHDLFTTASEATLILQGDYILDANPAAVSLLAWKSEQIGGRPLSSVCLPAYEFMINPSAFTGFTSLLPGSSIRQSESPVREAEIQTGPISEGGRIFNIRTVLLGPGNPPQIQMQIRDITSWVEMNRALQDMTKSLEIQVKERTASLEATVSDLDAFTYTVSHDLRSPLRAIDGNAHLLAEKSAGTLSDAMNHHLGRIRENVLRMDHLIDDLLNFSRMSRKPLETGMIDMTQMVREILENLVPDSDPLLQTVVENLPQARGDPALVRQVLQNLIVNAVESGRPGVVNTIHISALDDGTRVWYEVGDTGRGFDMKFSEKIFEVFFHLDSRPAGHGTGVGLAIVKRIITRHGGMIRVSSSEGVGSVFSFTLE